MLRTLRRSALVLSTLAGAALAPAAVHASEPTLFDLMRDVSDSIDEVSDATLEYARAQAEYDAQLEIVRAAARDVLALFEADDIADDADDALELPPLLDLSEAPSATPRLDALRLSPTPRLDALRLSPTPRLDALRLVPLAPKPILRRPIELAPDVEPARLEVLRSVDPNGTSIYDSLSFSEPR